MKRSDYPHLDRRTYTRLAAALDGPPQHWNWHVNLLGLHCPFSMNTPATWADLFPEDC